MSQHQFIRFGGTQTAVDVIKRIIENSLDRNDFTTCLFYGLDALQHHDGITTIPDSKDALEVHLNPFSSVQRPLQEVRGKNPSELALSSMVLNRSFGLPFHIPFADLRVPLDKHVRDRIEESIRDDMPFFDQLHFLNSGKSLHVYGDRLVTEDEYREFLGMILLWTYKGATEKYHHLADVRWVGHSLIRGFGLVRIHERNAEGKREARPEPSLLGIMSV